MKGNTMNTKILTMTKNQIIDEIVKISHYLVEHRLGDIRKNRNTWNSYKKDDLIDIYEKQIDVIASDMITKAKSGKVNIPELEELVARYNKKIQGWQTSFDEYEDMCKTHIVNIMKPWIGYDLEYTLNNCSIDIHIPQGRTINIYYRENDNTLEVNHPCWGSWNPKTDESSRRFFQAMAKLVNDDGWRHLDLICNIMCERRKKTLEGYMTETEIEREYKNDAMVIARKLVYGMTF